MNESSQERGKGEIILRVNGKFVAVYAHGMERLLDVLRHELGFTGTKEGCGEGEGGANANQIRVPKCFFVGISLIAFVWGYTAVAACRCILLRRE